MGVEHPGRAIDRVDADGYEPFVVDGKQVGEIRWLRTAGDQASTTLEVGLWRSDPATYDYLFAVDETFHVIEGAVTIELPASGEQIELEAGDIAFFEAGTPSVWTITKSFKKFVVTPPS
jgi:uncharacterized cupin superfamily protein